MIEMRMENGEISFEDVGDKTIIRIELDNQRISKTLVYRVQSQSDRNQFYLVMLEPEGPGKKESTCTCLSFKHGTRPCKHIRIALQDAEETDAWVK